jgi:transposase
MTTAHRYPHLNELDDEGVDVSSDLCKPCAKVLDAEDVIDIRNPMFCPNVDYDEGYTCDRCGRRIALVNGN